MAYRELQKKARELGLPYIGVAKAELEESIETALNKGSNPPSVPLNTAEENKEQDKVKMNTAVVYDGNHEVRRYSLDVHGEKFADLALQFIQDRKYTVKFINVQASHVCSSCGHRDFK